MKRNFLLVSKKLLFVIFILFAASSIRAATFTVSNTNDSGAGSLRQAILDANASAGADEINFDASFNVPRTITLGGTQLLITGGSLTINGPGMNLLTVSGNNQSRVFEIDGYTNGAPTVVINNLTVADGRTVNNGQLNGSNIGINIKFVTTGQQPSPANVTLNSVAVLNGDAGVNDAGGIACNKIGNLTINNSYIANNRGNGASAIYTGDANGFCFPTVNNTTIERNVGNTATIATFGGGINPPGIGVVTINNSTINDNVTTNVTSALRAILTGSLNLTNVTITRNRTNQGGPAVLFLGGCIGANCTPANLTNVTISDNFSGSSAGLPNGGFRAFDGFGTINLKNTIIANNFNPATGNDFYAHPQNYPVNSSFSIVENVAADSRPIPTGSGNLIGVDPLLDRVLRTNGGSTKTLALRSGSPAIDAGDPTTFPATDQRGIARPQDGDGNGTSRSDIGATEKRLIDTVSTPFDFDGDGKADVSVFRPSNGNWYLQQSTLGFTGIGFGQNGDKLAPADYDGDGRTDLAVVRNGTWYIQRSTLGFTGVAFGTAEDVPQPADYDGDGRDDVAVFRPSTGTWYLQRSTLGFTGISFGATGDKPVVGDYDGDSRADVAVNRNGIWYIQRSSLGFTGLQFGDANDKSVPADYDGDGKTDVAVFRPSNGAWYLQRSSLGFIGMTFGISTDLPVPADYDGDGRADQAVFRDGTWYLNRSVQGFTGVSFGAASDRPAPNAFVY